MRILLITDNHSATGGAEKYFLDLKKRLKNIPGAEVYSLGFGPEKKCGDDFYILKGLKSKAAKLLFHFVPHPFVYPRLKNHLKKIQPDIIHIHNIRQYTYSILKAIKPYTVVQTVHDYGVICPIGYNLHKNLEPCPTGIKRTCLWQHHLKFNLLSFAALSYAFVKTRKQLKSTVKKFFAPSPLLTDYLNKNHFEEVIHIPPFKPEVVEHSFASINPHHFLFAGNLGTHKGVYTLVEEFVLAHQKNPLLTLTIAGSGPEEKNLRKRIKTLGLENIIQFIGWKENLSEEYATCAAVIFPSLGLESFGLVMTEAMNHGRPVIGSNRGTPPWIIEDGETGYIFDPVKKGDLAAKILVLAGNKDLIIRLGSKGKEKLDKFPDNESLIRAIIREYAELVYV